MKIVRDFHGEIGKVVERWVRKHGIDKHLIYGYRIDMQAGEPPMLTLRMHFEEVPEELDPYMIDIETTGPHQRERSFIHKSNTGVHDGMRANCPICMGVANG